jgi:hypothetical protein
VEHARGTHPGVANSSSALVLWLRMLIVFLRPTDSEEDAEYSLEEDSFPLVRTEEELDASREDDEMSLDSEFGALFSMRDMAAYTVSMSSRPRRLKRLRWGFLCIRTSAGGREEKDEWSSGLGLLVAAAVAAAAAAVVNSEELAEVQVETVTKPPIVGVLHLHFRHWSCPLHCYCSLRPVTLPLSTR